jgi:hypothetical protein
LMMVVLLAMMVMSLLSYLIDQFKATIEFVSIKILTAYVS